MKTLVIKSSILGQNSRSNSLISHLLSRLEADDSASVKVRDLGSEPLPYFDSVIVGALFTPAEARTPDQQRIAAVSDTLIAELFEADRIIIAAPVYNFSIPAQLKTYLDYVARAGITFRYENGVPHGLLTGKQVIVMSSRGGLAEGADAVTPYLTLMLGFLGMSDVTFVTAEGMAMGEDAAEQGLSRARARIGRWVADISHAGV